MELVLIKDKDCYIDISRIEYFTPYPEKMLNKEDKEVYKIFIAFHSGFRKAFYFDDEETALKYCNLIENLLSKNIIYAN